MQDPKRFDALSTVVFLVGVAEGIVPFAAKLTDWWTPIFALPLYLDPPYWWIVSGLVAVIAVVALMFIERAKQRAAREGER